MTHGVEWDDLEGEEDCKLRALTGNAAGWWRAEKGDKADVEIAAGGGGDTQWWGK